MKKEIAKLWIKELRSEKWKQGTGVLRDNDNNYCCLGVLCELAIQNSILVTITQNDDLSHKMLSAYSYNSQRSSLPTTVMEWAKIKNSLGEFKINYETTQSLSALNDNSKTFNEIADIIEQNIDKL